MKDKAVLFATSTLPTTRGPTTHELLRAWSIPSYLDDDSTSISRQMYNFARFLLAENGSFEGATLNEQVLCALQEFQKRSE